MIWLGCLLAVLLSALFSGLETGLYCTSRLRIVLDAAAGQPAARRLQALMSRLPLVLTVLLVANSAASWASSFLAQLLLTREGVDAAAAVGTVLVTVVLFVFGESVPKSVFRTRQHALLYPLTPLLAAVVLALGWLVAPLSRLMQWLARRVSRRGAAEGSGSGADRDRDALVAAGAAEGLLTPFQQRVARGVLAMRSRTAAEEARPLAEYPVARLGRAGVELPPGCREHRVVVVDESGSRVAGWAPLAALWTGTGFRPPLRRELRTVARVEPGTSLDRVYLALDRSGTPLAVLGDEQPLRLLSGHRLRQRVMGGVVTSA